MGVDVIKALLKPLTNLYNYILDAKIDEDVRRRLLNYYFNELIEELRSANANIIMHPVGTSLPESERSQVKVKKEQEQ